MKNKAIRYFLGSILIIFMYAFVYAEPKVDAKPDSKKTKPATNVLDFEEDVIEGERAAPNLFIQMDLGAPRMDTLLFQRKNFNDFHAIDMKRKPKYRTNGKK